MGGGSIPGSPDVLQRFIRNGLLCQNSPSITMHLREIPNDNLIPQPFSHSLYDPHLEVRFLLPYSLILITDFRPLPVVSQGCTGNSH